MIRRIKGRPLLASLPILILVASFLAIAASFVLHLSLIQWHEKECTTPSETYSRQSFHNNTQHTPSLVPGTSACLCVMDDNHYLIGKRFLSLLCYHTATHHTLVVGKSHNCVFFSSQTLRYNRMVGISLSYC